MKSRSLLLACRDGLLALSDPDLLLLVNQWIETRAWGPDDAPTDEERVDNQLCLLLGYSVHSLKTDRQYPSLTAFLEAEAKQLGGLGFARFDRDYDLHPPPAEELRNHLAAMTMREFRRTVIACAFLAPPLGHAGDFNDPGQAFLAWLSRAIRENTLLERDRPGCLFYCFGYGLGLSPLRHAALPALNSDTHSLLLQVWENYVKDLIRQLEFFIEAQDELQALFLTWAARGLRDAQSSLACNPALEFALLLYKQTPEIAPLASTAQEHTPGMAALVEQIHLRLQGRLPLRDALASRSSQT